MKTMENNNDKNYLRARRACKEHLKEARKHMESRLEPPETVEQYTLQNSLCPKAGILDQASQRTPSITTRCGSATRRRPQGQVKYQEQIDNTIAKATIGGKAQDTICLVEYSLRQLQDKPVWRRQPRRHQ